MKLLWFLAVCCLTVSASSFDEDETRAHGENGWYVPHVDGSFEWVEKDVAESTMNIEEFDLSISPVNYYLYTNEDPSKGTKIFSTVESINASNFNAAHPTKFIIHGWNVNYLFVMNTAIKNAWLGKGDFNIIVVDWARARSVDYITSVLDVPTVGEKVAGMIDFLVLNCGMSLDDLTVIGHSLGAHIAGYSGKNVKTGQIHTIIGLDPALPLFSYDNPSKRLARTDAFYVETIQTNGGELGFSKPIGKGAFYPNGGSSQPGCTILDVAGSCAHGRSTTYYAEAIADDDFASIKCETYQDAKAKSCGATFSSVRMGALSNADMVSGTYYVPVKSKSLFGMLG